MIDKIPAIISRVRISPTENGTLFLRIVSAKCDFNHSIFPFQSAILSNPDCKNVMAKNAKMMISVLWFIGLWFLINNSYFFYKEIFDFLVGFMVISFDKH